MGREGELGMWEQVAPRTQGQKQEDHVSTRVLSYKVFIIIFVSPWACGRFSAQASCQKRNEPAGQNTVDWVGRPCSVGPKRGSPIGCANSFNLAKIFLIAFFLLAGESFLRTSEQLS